MMIPKAIATLLSFFAILILMTACHPLSDAEKSSAISLPEGIYKTDGNSDRDSLRDILSYLTEADAVSVEGGYTSRDFVGGRVYVKADEAQGKEILSILSSIHSSDFEKVENIEMLGAAVVLKVQKASQDYCIQILAAEQVVWVIVQFPDETSSAFQGKSASIPFLELKKVTDAVLRDRGDTENTAVITTLKEEKRSYHLMKVNAALLQNILEGEIETLGEYRGGEKHDFDVQAAFENITYKIDLTKGIFSREKDGETSLHKVEEEWLVMCRNLLQ